MNLVKILQMTTEQARTHLEAIRWPNGAVCPRCNGNNVLKLQGKSTRPGVYKCRDCRKNKVSPQFTVTVGTVFEDSHIPLNKWIGAFYLMCSSKKGVSANQLHRCLGVTYKSAWFMAHRVRFAMKTLPPFKTKLKGIVEVDETYIGGRQRKYEENNKFAVVALVERGGDVRTKCIDNVTAKTLRENILRQVDTSSILMTDQMHAYKKIGRLFKEHHAVNHSAGEYVRGNAYSNTAESFFALLKRGVYGTFHHVSGKHLFRYCDEFSFRWNNRKNTDGETTDIALKKAEGKRLSYRKYIRAEQTLKRSNLSNLNCETTQKQENQSIPPLS